MILEWGTWLDSPLFVLVLVPSVLVRFLPVTTCNFYNTKDWQIYKLQKNGWEQVKQIIKHRLGAQTDKKCSPPKKQSLTVIRHGKDGDLCDGARSALHSASTLIDGGQIGVHVTRETTTARHLLSSSRHLVEGGRHVTFPTIIVNSIPLISFTIFPVFITFVVETSKMTCFQTAIHSFKVHGFVEMGEYCG